MNHDGFDKSDEPPVNETKRVHESNALLHFASIAPRSIWIKTKSYVLNEIRGWNVSQRNIVVLVAPDDVNVYRTKLHAQHPTPCDIGCQFQLNGP